MTKHIDAVLFDMGDTLMRMTKNHPDQRKQAFQQLVEMLEPEFSLLGISAEDLDEQLAERAAAYKDWSMETLLELTEEELWTRWLLPDFPDHKIRALAVELNEIWRKAVWTGTIFPETREVTTELFRRGYRLGLVSNTTSSLEAPNVLKSLGISGLFETVVLSCVYGKRKPDPAILLHAAERMGVSPDRCAYVGDRPDRDVAASRKAGFAQVIILQGPELPLYLDAGKDLSPDYTIHNFNELLGLFPDIRREQVTANFGGNGRTGSTAPGVYDVSFSTMWALQNFPSLEDFFRAAPWLGFSHIELNHQIDSSMFNGVDLGNYRFSSVHEPCPADVSTEQLKTRDWMVSSLDEDNRQQGVLSMKRSIDLAYQLGVKALVVHPGHVRDRWPLEKMLYDMYKAGTNSTVEYQDIKERLFESRAALVEPHLEAVRKSLLELLEYAGKFDVRLGLENRYHYMDIPLPDEMETLLDLADQDRLGFWYDIGHAQVLDKLGYHRHEEWLERFSGRMTGVHLHDVVGIDDHQVPGVGEVDFSMVARYLPKDIIRTCELRTSTTPDQVKAGLRCLAEKGILKCL